MHEWVRAVQRLRRRPASAAAIVITVALGIGVSAGMFSVLHGVVLRALPYPDPDRLVRIYSENPTFAPARGGLTRAEVLEGLPDLPGFESTAYYVNAPPYIFTRADIARRVGVARVSADFFAMFGMPAALGRTLIAADFEEAGPVAVLSHDAWMELTGGDPSAVGRTLTFEEATVEIVGVLPPSFKEVSADAFVYLPFTASDLAAPRFRFGGRQIVAVGRLAAGASRTAALGGLAARMAAVNGEGGAANDLRFAFVGLLDELVAGVRVVLSGLFGVSMLVLLIACATAASLVAIRFGQRGTEIGLHRALGASGMRIAADLARELVLLAAAACLGGVLVAHFVLAALRPLAVETLPRVEGIAIDAATLWFAAAAAAATVLLTGGTSLLALRNDPGKRLRPGARQLVEGGRKPAVLPVAAVGMASVALAAALALSVSLAQLRNVDVGFRTQDVVALSLALDRRPPAEMYQGLDRVFERLRGVPGVADAAAAFGSPTSLLALADARTRSDGERTRAVFQQASEGYHGLLGIAIRRGRDITAADVEGTQRVAVVNETLARTMFGDADPLGQTLILVTGTEPVVIVGVAADRNNAGLRAPSDPEVVVPLHQWGTPPATLLVRWESEPPTWRALIRDVVNEADPQQLVIAGVALTDELNAQTRALRLFAFATNAFAVFALLLCGFGINAVIAAMQQRRAREIGLRMALGATPRQASALVLATAARIVAPGLVVAALLAVPIFRWLRPQLFDVGEASLWLLFAVAVLVSAAAALTAALWPARRAHGSAAVRVIHGAPRHPQRRMRKRASWE